jgi:hypothetical protein
MTRPLRAYAVTESGENTGGIIFARHDIVAKRWGANEYGDGDIHSMSCRRAPWADHLAESGVVPAKLMIGHGWHFECHGCGERIDEDWLRENHLPLDGVCGSQNGWVFCCARCKWRHMKYLAAERAAAEEAITCFKAVIRARFGDVEFPVTVGKYGGSHAYVIRGDRGGWHWQEVSVAFNFPGQQIGPAHLERRQPHGRGRNGFIGPVKPDYTCYSGDREAFEKFAAETKPQ